MEPVATTKDLGWRTWPASDGLPCAVDAGEVLTSEENRKFLGPLIGCIRVTSVHMYGCIYAI